MAPLAGSEGTTWMLDAVLRHSCAVAA
jgi:hypothetical protein